MSDAKLCSDCKHYLKPDYEGPCRGCNMRNEDNWEPVVDQEKADFEELLSGFQGVPGFTNTDMSKMLHELQEKEYRVWLGKNSDYASRGAEENPFSNFDYISEKLLMTPEQVLQVYLEKHLCAIEMYIKHGTLESGEGLLERIIDARNYLAILAGMAKRNGDI